MVTRELRHAVRDIDGPLAVVDLDAFDANLAALRQRAGGLPIRVASKSLRTPAAIDRALASPGYSGVLSYSLAEALALFRRGVRDIVVAYPSVDRAALRALFAEAGAGDSEAGAAGSAVGATGTITLMIDSTVHLDVIDAQRPAGDTVPIRICLDIDASLRLGEDLLGDRVHIGARRSPIRDAPSALALAEQVIVRKGFTLVGLMSYEGQIAGTANAGFSPAQMVTRLVQKVSVDELTHRRREIIEAITNLTELEFINGGGTGSLESSAAEGTLTELAAGSGLFAPGLFDGYTHFQHQPAAYFASPVVRRPAPGWVTVFKGGFIASGVPGSDRVPTIAWPPGLSYSGLEGAGEVQTPLQGPGAEDLQIGDLVWFRHAKAGELAEHFAVFHVVSGGEIVDQWTTYRGEGWVL